MAEFDMQRAQRRSQNLFLGVCGPTGCGKTYSLLRLAVGIQRITGGDVAMVDTEHGRGELYAEEFSYKYVQLRPPYSADRYQAAVQAVLKQGAKIVIVDSMSHEHEGPGGVLEAHEVESQRLSKAWNVPVDKAQFSAWRAAKAPRQRFVSYITTELDANLLMGLRAKEKSKPGDAKKKERGIIDMGWMPICGNEYPYEMQAFAILPPGSEGVPEWNPARLGEQMMTKRPSYFRELLAPGKQISEDMGEQMALWAAGKAKPLERKSEPPKTQDARHALALNYLKSIDAVKSDEELTILYDSIAADLKSGKLDRADRDQLRAAYDAREESFDEQP